MNQERRMKGQRVWNAGGDKEESASQENPVEYTLLTRLITKNGTENEFIPRNAVQYTVIHHLNLFPMILYANSQAPTDSLRSKSEKKKGQLSNLCWTPDRAWLKKMNIISLTLGECFYDSFGWCGWQRQISPSDRKYWKFCPKVPAT